MTMEQKIKVEQAVSAVIKALLDRRGFGDWWTDIKREHKLEIRIDLEEAIAKHMLEQQS